MARNSEEFVHNLDAMSSPQIRGEFFILFNEALAIEREETGCTCHDGIVCDVHANLQIAASLATGTEIDTLPADMARDISDNASGWLDSLIKH